jgi:hypothetical protein
MYQQIKQNMLGSLKWLLNMEVTKAVWPKSSGRANETKEQTI